VALATLGLAAGVLALPALLDLTTSREDEARRTLARLVDAIAGVPEAGTAGFVGDVGRLPKSLDELNDRLAGDQPGTLCDAGFTPPAAPVFHVADGPLAHRGRLGMGWRGPYARETLHPDGHLVDPWGRRFRYTCPQQTTTVGGVALTFREGRITSAGADGIFGTADDIPSAAFQDRGHLFLTVMRGGRVERNVTVTLFFPVDGEQASLTATPVVINGPEGPERTVVFASVPAGVRFADLDLPGNDRALLHVGVTAGVATRLQVGEP